MASPRTTGMLLELRAASVVLGGRIVLDDLTLEIPRGESVAILGPNGAGKSTLLRLLARDVYPQRREHAAVRILGRTRWNVFDLREQLGFVSLELQLRHQREIAGLDVVRSGFFGSIGTYPHQRLTTDQSRRVDRALDQLGVRALAGRTFATLSAGEQRRFLLARALVHDPHTLVLDEPTASLDLQAGFSLLAELRRLCAAGKTLVLVTHHLGEIPPEIERVLLLKSGSLFFDGDKRAALTSQRLSELFEIPLQVVERDGFYHAQPRG